MAQWLSFTLRTPVLILFATFTTALIGVIVALTVLSEKRNGFAQIPDSQTSLIAFSGISVNWSLGLLWTTLPTFVFTIYGLYWDSLAQSLADRQPFVELCHAHGAPSEKTIFLDYKSSLAIWRWIKAFKNGHILIGVSLLLSLIISLAVGPLSARLFVADIRPFSQTQDVVYNSSIDLSSLNASSDWRTIFDSVSATRIYNGSPLPWTDIQYAFLPFFPTPNSEMSSSNTSAVSLTANTTAYSAYLNCSALSGYKISLLKSTSNSGTITVSATDRGCDISQTFDVLNTQAVYFKTTSNISCSMDAWYSRLIFTYGVFSSTSSNFLQDISVISCITDYRLTTGDLTIAPASTMSRNTIVSFAPRGTPDDTRPIYWRNIEEDMLGPFSFNPDTDWSTTDFGSLILYYATKVLGGVGANLSTTQLLTSISEMFTASYLTAVVQFGTSTISIDQAEKATGTVVFPETRLFVVTWVAIIILVCLGVAFVTSICVLVYVHKYESILREEPQGLASAAGLLSESGLMTTAANIRSHPNYKGKFQMFARENPHLCQELRVLWQADQTNPLKPTIVRTVP